MPNSPWKKLPQYWPANGVTVWIRIISVMQPFQAALNTTTWQFETVTGYTCPWYMVDSWRPL